MRLRAFGFALVFLGLGLSAPAFAQSLTIQGRVLSSANVPITGNAVQFRVQVRAPNAGRCVLFDEKHTLDLSTTNGLFSVSLNDGTGTVNVPTTYTLEQAVSNRTTFTINSSYCSSGSGAVTYTPGTGDNRKVVIQFFDPSSMSGFETIPEMDLNPMAFAIESRSVGGYPATSLLRVDTAGNPGTAPSFTAGEASELQLLAQGTSTKYTPASATNGAQIPTYSSDPSAPPAGSIWYNSTSGELHFRTGGGTQVVGTGGGGGGTITSITVSGGLSGGGSSGAVSIGLPTGSTGQVLRHNGGNWGGYNFGLPDLLSTSLGSAVTAAGCTSGQAMYYDSVAKELKCQSIGLSSSDLSGTLGVAHGGTGLTAGTVGALPYFSSTSALSLLAAGSSGDVLTMNGSGVPVWQSLPAASFSGTGTANRVAKFTGSSAVGNSILTDDGTNVGVGTTAPIARLEVAGSLRLADGGETCSAGANVGMMKYSGGSLFFCNASGWQTLGVSGAGLTSLNGLTANTQTFAIGSAGTTPAWSSAGSVHTLNLPTASASNSGILSSTDWSTFNGKLGASSVFAGDVTGTYNANVVTKLQGVAVGTAAPASGQFLKYTSSWNAANLGFGDLKTTGGAATMASAVCTAGQAMYYDTTTGDLKCQSIAVDNASITGVLPIANGGTGANSTSQSYVFAGPSSGSGAPSFRALTAADISGLNTYWTSATGGINYAGGNAGIGTTAPAAPLHVYTAGNAVLRAQSTGADGNIAKLDLIGGASNASWSVGTNYSSASGAADNLFFYKNAGSAGAKLVIQDTGNVGIGTTVPAKLLHVEGSADAGVGAGIINRSVSPSSTAYLSFGNDAAVPSTGGALYYYSSAWSGGSWASPSSMELMAAGNATGGLQLRTSALAPVTIRTGSLERMRVDSGGNVGIGTTAPAALFEVQRNFSGAGNVTAAFIGGTDASVANTGIYVDQKDNSGLNTNTSYLLSAVYNNSPRFVVTGLGNVGIGSSVPSSRLDVSGSLRIADGGESCSGGTNVGMMKYSGGSLFFCNASGWQTLGVSGAGLTSLNGLTANTQTFAVGSAGTSPAWSSSGSVHTLNLPTASASNSGVLSSTDWSTFNGKLGASSVFAGDVTGTYNATVVTKIQGVAVGTTTPATGQFLKYGASSWSPASLTFADVKTTGGAATLSTAACNAGQTMYYDSSTGDLKCQSIALGNASITGILPIANGGTGASSTSQNYVFAGPTSGSGAPSFRALTAGDLPASASYWQAGTGGINYMGGNVGIGVTNPAYPLSISTIPVNQAGVEQYGAWINTSFPTADTNYKAGLRTNTYAAHTTGTQTYLVGMQSLAQASGSGGTTTQAMAHWGRVDAQTGATVTSAYNYFSADSSSVGTMTNQYGFYSDPLSKGTNRWAFYAAGATPSYFGGNVGIGSTAPGSLLDVGGMIRMISSTQYNGLTLQNGTYESAKLYGQSATNDNGVLGLNLGGVNYVTVRASGASYFNGGNVGIGTSSPNGILEVTKPAASDGFPATTGTAQNGLVARLSSGTYGSVMDFGMQGNTTGKNWIQVTDKTNLSLTYPLLLNPNGGNVGIATTAPRTALEVKGEMATTINTGYANYRMVSPTYGSFFRNDSNTTYLLLTANGDPYGQWNGLRPFYVDNATGNVFMANSQVSVNHSSGALAVQSCSGCSVIAEMMPIEGDIEEGMPVCIDASTGKISRCSEDRSLRSLGIATNHAEQILRLGCSKSTSEKNSLTLGGKNDVWQLTPECKGWYPVALTGVHEFVKAECTHRDGTPLRFGDRLVTSGAYPGYARPLDPGEEGGDAVLGRTMTVCSAGERFGTVHVKIH